MTAAVATVYEGYGWVRNHTRQHTLPFQDFTIDDRPLTTWFGAVGEPNNELTPLSEEREPHRAALAVSLLDFLLGDRPGFYDDGCDPILICPVDLDLECGALGVQVVRDRDTVTWRLGWHTYYPYEGGKQPVERHRAPRPPLRAAPEFFTFDLAQHDEVLRQARGYYRARAGVTPALPWF